jgi:pyruvate ferredoxin oxidoreductase gamma subunit
MFEIRIHGRGGQGVVTAAELLSTAAFHEGFQAQAFPSFGSERTGAPVVSFCRLDEHPIRVREPIVTPDALIIIDPTLLHQVDVFGGWKSEGYVLINSSHDFEQLGLASLQARTSPDRVCTVPATEVARELLGRPLPNAALLGGFAALAGRVSLPSITRAIGERFGDQSGPANAAAAERTYELVRAQLKRPASQRQLLVGTTEVPGG